MTCCTVSPKWINSFKNTLKLEDVVQFQLALAADWHWNCRLDGLTTTMRQHFVSEGSSRSTFAPGAHWHLRGQDQDCHLQHHVQQLLLQPLHSGHWAQQGPNFQQLNLLDQAQPKIQQQGPNFQQLLDQAQPKVQQQGPNFQQLNLLDQAQPKVQQQGPNFQQLKALRRQPHWGQCDSDKTK